MPSSTAGDVPSQCPPGPQCLLLDLSEQNSLLISYQCFLTDHLETPPLLDIAHPQETLERLAEAGGEVSAVLAVFEVSVVGSLVVGGEEAGYQDRAWRRSEVGVSGVESVEGLQSLHHPGQGTGLGLSADL